MAENKKFRLYTLFGYKCVSNNDRYTNEYIIIDTINIQEQTWSVIFRDVYVDSFGNPQKGRKWREDKHKVDDELFNEVISFLEKRNIPISNAAQ